LLAAELMIPKLEVTGRSSALSITPDGLAKKYLEEDDSLSQDGAKKMALRDLNEIRAIFGLEGDSKRGYQLGMVFEKPVFRNMFAYWLETIETNRKTRDRSLSVMLHGLLQAIDSAFTYDPVDIPDLAKELRKRYELSNIRDTHNALRQLFDCRCLDAYLPLRDLPDEVEHSEKIMVDVESRPVFLKLRSWSEVGDNADDTLVLVRPGETHPRLRQMLADTKDEEARRILRIAKAVHDLELWQTPDGRQAVPYTLHFEQLEKEFVLVVYWLDDACYEDIPLGKIDGLPAGTGISHYIPEGLDEKLWNRWKSLAAWR